MGGFRFGGFPQVVFALCARCLYAPRFSYRRGAWGCLCFLKSSGFAAFDRPKAAEKPPLFRSGGNPAALILRFAPGATGFLIRPHSDAADPRHKAERRLENDAKRTQRAARQTVGRTHHFLNASWDRKRAGRRKVYAIGVGWEGSGSVALRKWFLPCVRDAFTRPGFPHLVRRMCKTQAAAKAGKKATVQKRKNTGTRGGMKCGRTEKEELRNVFPLPAIPDGWMPAGVDPGGVWGTFVPHFQWADGKRAFPGRGPEQPTGRYLVQSVQGPREPTEGIPKGPQALWSCGRRVEIGGGFSVPFWRQKGTPVSSLQKADTFPGHA